MPASPPTTDANNLAESNDSSDTDTNDISSKIIQHSTLLHASSSLPSLRLTFQNDGFLLFHHVIHLSFVSHLQTRLEHVLRGRFDRGVPPDKMPKVLTDNYPQDNNANGTTTGSNRCAPLGFSPHNSKTKVIQIINIHKCDTAYRELATCPEIGRMVGMLAGWTSVRLAQDQVWAK